jgi:hypothetical protein
VLSGRARATRRSSSRVRPEGADALALSWILKRALLATGLRTGRSTARSLFAADRSSVSCGSTATR